MNRKVVVREAEDSDLDDVLSVQRAAFDSDEEANLVRDLLGDASAKPIVSLLACRGDCAVGHILFTRARLEPGSALSLSLLAPLAVVPQQQGQGIGGALIAKGFDVLAQAAVDIVFVLGYPQYYRRHGFEPAANIGFVAPYPIAEKNADAWMARALRPEAVGAVGGKIICAETLSKPEYWRE